ncbi:hypothetical protein LTR36_006319 [Oleoguttula mirabilis]|uniref:Zn(2)-C6 fungal-type domain-containing protein n=1 Tax=Oleoguttula mirabilis TaxID=1507867 RepID=A0AAV9JUU7_9PEZI|nr:hypothetical protein LTR36_006319 [Oleoguttula mirabilis]
MLNSSAAQIPNGEDDHHIRLACQACQRKKIKCDRSFPCGPCSRSNLHCAPSTRKPRTRHAGKRAVDGELRNRISKLESLVEGLSGEVGLQDGVPGASVSTPAAEQVDSAASHTVGKYIGSTFWSSLTTEVQALRDALEEDQQEDDEPTSPTMSTNSANGQSTNDYDLLICPPNAIYVMPGALTEPSSHMQAILYSTFIRNVAPMYKIFHIPTLRRFLERASLWFAAINTLSDGECQMQFSRARSDLLQQYRRVVDVLLAQADLMNTNDLATLQAFMTTLIASRITDHSRRAWTMTALVVRIARAMGLHHEISGLTPFEAELRRCLWQTIRFLDVFVAIDRATEVLISVGSWSTRRPKNVDDLEYDESSASIPSHDGGLTDMSFALLASEACDTTLRLNNPEASSSGDPWQQRLDIAHTFGKHVQNKYIQYCDRSIPFHRLISAIGKSMSASMILRAVRPMMGHVSSVPPRVDSPYVLQIAMDALREHESIFEDPEAERWRWLVWVQWHGLAVALAGLCSVRGTELAEKAWACVDKAYDRHSRHVADTRNGMLWRPIEKLHKKASSFRDAGRRESQISGFRELQLAADLPGTATPMPTYPPLAQQPPMNHHGMPMGSMPMDPIMSGQMDFGSTPGLDDMMPLQPGDAGWLDWECIMEDFSNMPLEMGDLQQPQQVRGSDGLQWPCVLHSDLV